MALIAYFYRQVTEVQRMSESHTVPTLGVTELVSGLGPGYSSHALYCQAMLPPHQGPPHVGRVLNLVITLLGENEGKGQW